MDLSDIGIGIAFLLFGVLWWLLTVRGLRNPRWWSAAYESAERTRRFMGHAPRKPEEYQRARMLVRVLSPVGPILIGLAGAFLVIRGFLRH